MRIGFFTNAYEPTLSGVVNSIKNFKLGLEKAGHEVIIIAPEYPGFIDASGTVLRFRSMNVDKEIDFPLPIPHSRRLIAAIKAADLDVIHAQHPFLLGSLGARLGRRWGIPVLTTIHTQYELYSHYFPMPPRMVSALARTMVRRHCRQCDTVVTPSASMQEYLTASRLCEDAAVVPNAVDVERFGARERTNLRSELGLKSSDFVIGNVGRMAKEKNIEFLLDLAKSLRTDLPDLRLLLVGGGPQLDELRNRATELELSESVVFTGPIDYQAIPDYFNAMDLFVMASVTEVQPLSLIESMAAGRPILGVRAFGSQDLITDSEDGFLVGLDISQYKAKILQLADNRDLLVTLGEQASQNARKYSITRATERLLEVYEKSTSCKKRPGP